MYYSRFYSSYPGRTYPANKLLDIKVTEGSVTEPVTLTQLKDHARISGSDDDAYILTLITSARQAIEKFCGISIVEKSIILHIDNSAGGYELPYGPVKEITGTTDTDGDVVTIETKGLDNTTITTTNSFLAIEYTVGYDEVPTDLQLAILKEAAWHYEHRGDEETDIKGLCPEARSLAVRYRRVPWLA